MDNEASVNSGCQGYRGRSQAEIHVKAKLTISVAIGVVVFPMLMSDERFNACMSRVDWMVKW